MYSKVYDVLEHVEDCDHVRIIKNGRCIASGQWFMDCILNYGDRAVRGVDYDNSGDIDIWNIEI